MKEKSLIRNNLGVRLGIITLLIVGLLIPSVMVSDLIYDRQAYRDQAIQEVTGKWGQAQTIAGPVLSVPYEVTLVGPDNKSYTQTQYLHFLPEELKINGEALPEVRPLGIYEVVLYEADLEISGYFLQPDAAGFNIPPGAIRWKDAFLAIGISDMTGIRDLVEIHWGDEILEYNPGIESRDVLYTGVSAPVDLSTSRDRYPFSGSLHLNGSDNLMFTPVGKENTVHLKSSWPSPGFAVGASLPDSREVSEQGFEATWKVLHLNRNYPQSWSGTRFALGGSEFGVSMILPVDHYQKTMRTSKYAIMFIVLTFTAFFLIELLNRKLLHPIQYLLVGLALLVFYTLLLSFSEQIGFGWAYLISALGIVGLISGYAKAVLGSLRLTGIVFGVLAILYGYLYVVLQLEDLALLMGSLGLFAVLGLIMYLTRKINWYDFANSGISGGTKND